MAAGPSIDVLHGDVLSYTFQFLEPIDLVHCESVCKSWQKFAKDKVTWIELFLRKYPSYQLTAEDYEGDTNYWKKRLFGGSMGLRVVVVDTINPRFIGLCRYLVEVPKLARLSMLSNVILHYGRRRPDCLWNEHEGEKLLPGPCIEARDLHPVDEYSFSEHPQGSLRGQYRANPPGSSPSYIAKTGWEHIGRAQGVDQAVLCYAVDWFYNYGHTENTDVVCSEKLDAGEHPVFKHWELCRWLWKRIGKDGVPPLSYTPPVLDDKLKMQDIPQRIILMLRAPNP